MTLLRSAFVLAALLPLTALADPPPWAGHGHGHEGKQEYWDGNCKVERKWHHGEMHEKRKCRAPAPAAVYVPAPQPVYVAPPPVVVQPAPVVVQPVPVIEPGLVIQGTVRLK